MDASYEARGVLVSSRGGVLSTATDVARWLQMLLLNGQHPETNERVVPAAIIHQVATGIMGWRLPSVEGARRASLSE
ncbi:hypothetical protein B0H17DRAFT_1195784 [Mycena rosella]|uniref:Uncharacterized protein n=1 Tax=Mycena rosella TaxID=1033263 RepID=A0AAD7DXP1_MYCRO|nr:hypothetical protein B0H17DRAFT_1195784 [Mycena rosella]